MTGLPDPDQVTIPDVAEPIRAYRVWTVAEGQLLEGANSGVIWPVDGPLIARCLNETSVSVVARAFLDDGDHPLRVTRHEVPCPPDQVAHHVGHGCGIYGLAHPAQAVLHVGTLLPFSQIVYGEVLLSGRYYEYSEGWRAERGHIGALWTLEHPGFRSVDRSLLDELAARYGTTVTDPPVSEHDLTSQAVDRMVAAIHAAGHYVLSPAKFVPINGHHPVTPEPEPTRLDRVFDFLDRNDGRLRTVVAVIQIAGAAYWAWVSVLYLTQQRWGYAVFYGLLGLLWIDGGISSGLGKEPLTNRTLARLLSRIRRHRR